MRYINPRLTLTLTLTFIVVVLGLCMHAFTALHGMQTRSSDENSVCLSVRPSAKCIPGISILICNDWSVSWEVGLTLHSSLSISSLIM